MWIKCGERWLNLSECGEIRHTSSGDYSVIVQGICRTVAEADAEELQAVLQAQERHTQHMLPILCGPALPRDRDPIDGMPLRIHVAKEEK